MFVLHVKLNRRRAAVAAAAALLVVGLTLLLSGCLHGRTAPSEPVPAAENADRVAYLTELGWQVAPEPVETLNLELPEDLSADYKDYLKLQQSQGMPFGKYGGRQVQRFTYNILNYPGIQRGVQADLYLCDGVIIGGDVISSGENSFLLGLEFPKDQA